MALDLASNSAKYVVFGIVALVFGCAAQDTTAPWSCPELDISFIVEDANINIWWTPNSCAMGYNIWHYVNEQLDSQTTIPHPVTWFTLTRINCSRNLLVISTIPLSGLGALPNATTNFTIGYGGNPPTHLGTTVDSYSAVAVWLADHEPYDLCRVEQLVFEIYPTDGNGTTYVYTNVNLNVSSIVNQTLAPLQPNTTHAYTLCYVFQGINSTVCGEDIWFTTLPSTQPPQPPPPPPPNATNLWIEVNSSGINAFWFVNNTEFISGFMLRIEVLGPNHFIPDYCYVDLFSIGILLNASTTNYKFTDIQPNFRYSVQLETLFNNATANASLISGQIVTTPEGVPGALDIRTSFQGTPSSPYDVSVKADWRIPCNINGIVRNFTYILTGTLGSNSTGSSTELVLGRGSFAVSDYLAELETFTVSIPGVLPFFKHTLIIRTYFARENGTTVVDLGHAPPAYTSPDWQCSSWKY